MASVRPHWALAGDDPSHDREKAVSAMSAATRLELNRHIAVQEWPEFIRRNSHLGKDGLALFLACVSNDVGTIERLLKKRLFARPVDVNQVWRPAER